MTITDDERREIAAKIRGNADDMPFYGDLVADAAGADFVDDEACWKRLADLIEPAPTSSDRGLKCDRDALLALADDLDYAGANIENVAYFDQTFYESARRIREAVNAFECDSDAPMAGDDWQGGTDAHADEGEAADGARTPSIEVLRWVKDNGGIDAVKKRLMPEGMEWLVDAWPRFEDGKSVRIGDEWSLRTGGTAIVGRITLCDDNFALNASWYDKGERVKRPVPKVYDADGVEIRVGDKLYDVDTGCERTVRAVNNDKTIEFDGYDNRGWFAWCFTHRAPVIAADGKPLREGETVYKIDDDRPYTLKQFDGDHVYINAGGSSFDIWTFPNKLTHQRPDSWERLEEDANLGINDYRERYGIKRHDGMTWPQLVREDLVRRAKALAGVE